MENYFNGLYLDDDCQEVEEFSLALENKCRELQNMILPYGYKNPYSNFRVPKIEFLDTFDAYKYCLREIGRVDIEYIAHITFKTFDKIINDLRGRIFQNPDKWEETFYKGFETREKYLSGNLTYKVHRAIEVGYRYNNYFESNIAALRSVMPARVDFKDIYITLGTPWLQITL